MYGIFTYIGVVWGVNVGIYGILHGVSGYTKTSLILRFCPIFQHFLESLRVRVIPGPLLSRGDMPLRHGFVVLATYGGHHRKLMETIYPVYTPYATHIYMDP